MNVERNNQELYSYLECIGVAISCSFHELTRVHYRMISLPRPLPWVFVMIHAGCAHLWVNDKEIEGADDNSLSAECDGCSKSQNDPCHSGEHFADEGKVAKIQQCGSSEM